MTYRDSLTAAMTALAADPQIRFVGYGLTKNGAGGTLRGVDRRQMVECLVAENLLVGVATGLSLAGLKPVVFIERMDFILNAMDAIVNHLVRIRDLSDREFQPAAIIRCVVGNSKKPLYTGATHTQNYSAMFADLPNLNVFELDDAESVAPAYEMAHKMMTAGITTLLVEKKDLL